MSVDDPAVVDEDDVPGGYIELFVSFEAPPGQEDERDADGFPLHYFKLSWLDPQQLLAIATDLAAADNRGEDLRGVLQTWQRAALDGMLDGETDEDGR